MPEFGLRSSARLVLTAILMAIVWFGLNWLMPPLSKAKILEFSASAKTITAGETVELFYGVSDASGVRIDPQPGEVEVLEQNVRDVTPDETTTYSLRATDSDGLAASRQLTVDVVGERDLRITLLNVSPQTITLGQTASLCYEVREAVDVQINLKSDEFHENRSGDAIVKECFQVAPSQTTAYTLTATGKDGKQATQTVSLNVLPPDAVRIDFFKADSPTINDGGKTRLCYQVTNATGGTQIVSNFGETVVVRDNCATVAPKQTTIYTLKATGSSGQQAQSLTVTVVPPGLPEIDEFSATPSAVEPGGTVQLCYQAKNTDQIGIDEQGKRIVTSTYNGQRSCIVVTPLKTTIYGLYAMSKKNGGTITARTLTVDVKPNPIRISVTLQPTSVTAGKSVVLCANVVGGIKPYGLLVNPSVFKMVGVNFGTPYQACGSITPTETTRITVTVTDASGQMATGQATVEVKQPVSQGPWIKFFTAGASVVAPGEQVNLCYEVENADGVTFSWNASAEKTSSLIKSNKGYKTALIIAQKPSSQQGPSQPRSPLFVKGSKNCVPFEPSQTTTYTIEATNDTGKRDTKSIVVTVQQQAPGKQGRQWPAPNVSEQNTPSDSEPSVGLTTGELAGGVFDKSGKPVAFATVVATNVESGNKRSVKTNASGQFVLSFLPPGNYKVTASLKGYLDTAITIMVPVNRRVSIRPPNITLRRADSNSNK
jgi:uncharacterized cupredoxin-like copper-binding protein